MINSTCVPENHTGECPPAGSSAGPIAGVVVFFLLAAVAGLAAAATVVYVRRGGRVPWWPAGAGRRAPGKAEDVGPAVQRAASHQYTTMTRAPCDGGHNAIYENYSGPPGETRTPAEDGHMYPLGPEEDLYCQCDTADDAIYGNDPACSLAMLPEPHIEDDLYIMPDV